MSNAPTTSQQPTSAWHAWTRRQVATWNRQFARTPRNAGSKAGNPLAPSNATSGTDRQVMTPDFRRSCRTVGAVLRPLSSHVRHQIAANYRVRGGQRRPLNDARRALLAEAVFDIENALELRQPSHPQVRLMRAVRNRLYDELGWNSPTAQPVQES